MAGSANQGGMGLVAALVVTVAVVAGGASLAVHGWPQRSSDPWSDGSSGSGPGSQPTLPGASSPAPVPAPAQVQGLVELVGDARNSPDAAAVEALLERHFTAINAHNFAAWTETVTPRRVSSISSQRWQINYESTSDSQVVVSRIAPTSSGDVVDLTFVSVQDPTDAPAGLPVRQICWNSHWPVVDGLIDVPATGSTTKNAC